MSETKNYHLSLTDDDNTKVKEWRETINGSSNSNMQKIDDALSNKQDKLTGAIGQVVGFDENGNAVAQAAPDTGVTSFNGRNGDVMPQNGDYTAELIGAAPVDHTHDDRYYTEEEINDKLSRKADINHTHSSDPGVAPAEHTHDDRYYTETEVDEKLAEKSAISHTHTAEQIGAAGASHIHDDRYYTETEMNEKLAKKSDTSHTHTAKQIGAAGAEHTHDDRYYTETEIDTKLSRKSDTSHTHTAEQVGAATAVHTHDDRYYTESEVDTKLSGKANTSHTHNYAGSSSVGGVANSAVKLNTARTISLAGDCSGSTTFDGSANKTITATLANSGVTAGTYGADLFKMATSVWITNNRGLHSTSAVSTWTAKQAMSVSFKYEISSETNCDKLSITAAGTSILSATGGTVTKTLTCNLTAGQSIVFTYSKDGSANTGEDRVKISEVKVTPTGGTATSVTTANFTSYFTAVNGTYGFLPLIELQTKALTSGNTSNGFTLPRITVDSKGRVTSASEVFVVPSDVASTANSANTATTATTATKLATARTIQVNLASTSAASFNGSANVTPGVTGVLPIQNGGTGNTTGNAATATKLKTTRTIDGVSFDGSASIVHFGVCNTDAATAAKVVTLTGSQTFTLTEGARVLVLFTKGSTMASNTTLNVNGTGAHNILTHYNTWPSSAFIDAGNVIEFVYYSSMFIAITANANRLSTSRTFLTNLASTSAASFNGSANVTPGVTGVLPIQNGGTGNTTGNAATATKLANARTVQVNLGSTSAASFNGTANVTPGVTGTLGIGNGGTGGTNSPSAIANLINNLSAETTLATDDYFPFRDTSAATGKKITASYLRNYLVPAWAQAASKPTYTASEVGALPITGGTLTGNLIIKGSGNYGTKINLGDGDYVHISEPTDDCLEIKAKKINFVVSDTSDERFTLNGAAIGGGDSVQIVSGTYTGNARNSSETEQTINIGFTPRFVFVGIQGDGSFDLVPWALWEGSTEDKAHMYAAYCASGVPFYAYDKSSSSATSILRIVSNGFAVRNFSYGDSNGSYFYYLNSNSYRYIYIAFA